MLQTLILAAEEHGAEDPPNPILPVDNEIFWGVVTFAVLYILFWKVLLPPVVRVMDERENRLRTDRRAVDEAQEQMGSVRDEYDAALADARAEANALHDAARAEADAYRAEKIEAANAEIAQLRAEATTEIEAAKAEALRQLQDDVVDLAVGAASSVMQKDLDRAAQLQVIEDYVNRSSSTSTD
ncbi:MAG: F0F1 ATP synthase subunit B [Actinomycetota bacterium]|nr:F0F1 ATP synthase subunit B [Actinomycetota bacterium]